MHRAKALAAPPLTLPEANSPSSSCWHRPKGPLPGQEMDSDSEDEGDDAIQLSKSAAHERLKQFAARRGIVSTGSSLLPQSDADEVPGRARVELKDRAPISFQQPAAPLPAPEPIPVMHPFGAPVDAIPSTPRTTRRQMLKNEMSESLRRQLLWQRYQARVSTTGTTGVCHVGPQRTSTVNGVKSLTTTPSMIQLHAKGTTNDGHLQHEVEANGNDAIPGSGERTDSARSAEAGQAARRQALARHRSWINEYHTSGW